MIIVYLLLFSLFVLISTGLGAIVCNLLRVKQHEFAAFSLTLSIVIWTLFGYLFGYLQARWMSFLLIPTGFVSFWMNRSKIFLSLKVIFKCIRKINIVFAMLVIFGISSQLMGIVGSGVARSDGSIAFHRLQSSDGLMHLAFSESIKRQFPPQQPGASGLAITNYHYWSNLYFSEISRVFMIPLDLLFFQFVPIILSILLLVNLLLLTHNLGATKTAQFWISFFYFFAGNATFLFSLLMKGDWLWNSPAIDHGVIQFYNPPQTLAKLLLFLGSSFLLKYIARHDFKMLIASTVVFATLYGFKIYFGLFGAMVLGSLFIYELIWRKNYKALPQAIFAIILYIILSLAIFLPPNKTAGGLFWAPLAWPKILLGMEYLDFNEWWLRLQVYESYHNIKGMSAMYAIAVAIFSISIIGTRLLGLITIFEKGFSSSIRAWKIIYSVVAIVFFYIGMNYLQVSGGANVFNFMILTLIIMGILSGFSMDFLKRSLPKVIYSMFAIIIVLLSIPRPLHEVWLLYQSWSQDDGSFVMSKDEHEALIALKQLPQDSTYQSHPKDVQDYHETPYRSFYSGKSAYLAGKGILNSHNQPILDREKNMTIWFNSPNVEEFISLGHGYDIDYIFIPIKLIGDFKFNLQDATQRGLITEAYRNSHFVIYSLLQYN